MSINSLLSYSEKSILQISTFKGSWLKLIVSSLLSIAIIIISVTLVGCGSDSDEQKYIEAQKVPNSSPDNGNLNCSSKNMDCAP